MNEIIAKISKWSLLIIFGIILIVTIHSALADSCDKTNLIDRLTNDCRMNDSICNDGETPFDSDCAVTSDSISCTGGSCVFKTTWMLKLLLIALAILFYLDYKKYSIPLLIISGLVFVNYILGGFDNIMPISTNTTTPHIVYTTAAMASPIYQIGSHIWSSQPIYGFYLGVLVVALIVFYLFDNLRGRR